MPTVFLAELTGNFRLSSLKDVAQYVQKQLEEHSNFKMARFRMDTCPPNLDSNTPGSLLLVYMPSGLLIDMRFFASDDKKVFRIEAEVFTKPARTFRAVAAVISLGCFFAATPTYTLAGAMILGGFAFGIMTIAFDLLNWIRKKRFFESMDQRLFELLESHRGEIAKRLNG